MNPLFIILSILEGLARIAVNPELGLGSDGIRLARLMAFVGAVGREGPEGYEKLKELDERIQAIEAGQVSNLAADWDAYEARHKAAFDRIQAHKRDD